MPALAVSLVSSKISLRICCTRSGGLISCLDRYCKLTLSIHLQLLQVTRLHAKTYVCQIQVRLYVQIIFIFMLVNQISKVSYLVKAHWAEMWIVLCKNLSNLAGCSSVLWKM